MGNWAKARDTIVLMCVAGAAVYWLGAEPPQRVVALPACSDASTAALAGTDVSSRALACADLTAQESMALSTARLVWLNWLQIAVAAAGAVAVIATLRHSNRTADLSRDAIEQQQIALRHQLRPALVLADITVTPQGDGDVRATIRYENVGGSPARNVKFNWLVELTGKENAVANQMDNSNLRFDPLESERSIARGSDFGMFFTLTPAEYDEIVKGTGALQYAMQVIYDDDFGGRYKSTSARSCWDSNLSAFVGLDDFSFTDPLLSGREV